MSTHHFEEEDLPDAVFECDECDFRGDLSDGFNYDVDGDSEGWYPSYSCARCGEEGSPTYIGLERDGVKKSLNHTKALLDQDPSARANYTLGLFLGTVPSSADLPVEEMRHVLTQFRSIARAYEAVVARKP